MLVLNHEFKEDDDDNGGNIDNSMLYTDYSGKSLFILLFTEMTPETSAS